MEIALSLSNCRPRPRPPNNHISFSPNNSSSLLFNNPNFASFPLPPSSSSRKASHRRRLILRASSSPPDDAWLQRLSQSILRDFHQFSRDFKNETTGFLHLLPKLANNIKDSTFIGDLATRAQSQLHHFNTHTLPAFILWHKWDRWNWKDDPKTWEPKRKVALALYSLAILFSLQFLIRAPLRLRQRNQMVQAYIDTLIPPPTSTNITKFKKAMWRKITPKGLKLKRFFEKPDGTITQDSSYVGENAWVDDISTTRIHAKEIIEDDEENKLLEEDVGAPGFDNQEHRGTWHERLQKWKEIIWKEKLAEQLDSLHAKYAVEFDMKEVENSLRKDVVERIKAKKGTRGFWISQRWWSYRPKLPYTYFLQKLDSSEVAAVVFSMDLKRLYAIMREGFPLEYTVDIPLDPFLFEIVSNSGVEIDMVSHESFISRSLKLILVILPVLVILVFIKEFLTLLPPTFKRTSGRKYTRFFDMMYAENFITSGREANVAKAMYKEVVLGGDIWDLLDELMRYMENPMLYYEKDVKFVRGVLLTGPPGTGKTLFARSLAKRCGMPFVFASGAEFSDNKKSGVVRINEMFSTARKNAPSFIFVDEIDAIVGRHARNDPRRKAAFDALITQLDGDKEKTGVNRFSQDQAVIFICATNRPDELDPDFLSPGRIDRRVYIGLPNASQRVQIFGVHSRGKQLAEDVEFEKLVFRTVGYSGADIRNLVNEAAIMSVRKAHPKICQQDIVDVLDKQLLEGMGVLLTVEEQQKSERSVSIEKKRLLAVHEAGHILLAHLLPQFDGHAFSQLLPGGKETAITVFYPREEMVHQTYMTYGYLKMQMVVAHGGRCAERIIFGDDITDGGRDDLKKITMLAREMVISPGNPRLGLTALTKKIGVDPERSSVNSKLIKFKWDSPRVVPADMTIEVSELFSRELTRYIEETEEIAMTGLIENREILEMITGQLLEKSRITGPEAEEKINGMSPQLIQCFADDDEQDQEGPYREQVGYKPLDIYPAPLHS